MHCVQLHTQNEILIHIKGCIFRNTPDYKDTQTPSIKVLVNHVSITDRIIADYGVHNM